MFGILEEMMGRERFREFRQRLSEERRIWAPLHGRALEAVLRSPSGADGPAANPSGTKTRSRGQGRTHGSGSLTY
jgi:hypothetical protein